MSTSYLVRTHGLSKVYQGKEAVMNVSMHLRKGEIYGFLGPNGAGKTTVMRMLLNLVKPTSGEIEIFGNPLTATRFSVLKRMGSMIEYPVFYEKLSARDNLELHASYMGYHQPGAAHEAMKAVHLADTGETPVKQFSLGMKQRLGIARALLTKPELLILDEPLNGLDPIGVKEIRQLFLKLKTEYGMTLLISSHRLPEIEQVADTIGLIDRGALIEETQMSQLRSRYARYIELKTPDLSKAAVVLEQNLLIKQFKQVDDATLRIYDTLLPISEITQTLALEQVRIGAISEQQASLEDYFVAMIERRGEQRD